MKMEISGQYFLKDNEIKESKEFSSDFLNQGTNIYEVIRVIKGIPLFFEDHFNRFQTALQMSFVNPEEIPEISTLQSKVLTLIRHCHFSDGNIKIVYHSFEKESFLILYPVEHCYPSEAQYIIGVKTAVFKVERIDPTIKNWRSDYKKKVALFKKEKAVYELILMRNDGIITEGSQSNIYFIKDDTVYTAPESLILSGITRKHVVDICYVHSIPLIEKEFDLNFALQSETVFLSGTSPKILPVSQIDEKHFRVNHRILQKLMAVYDEKTEAYLKK